MIRLAAAILLVILFCSPVIESGELKKEVLRYKLDRFYFDSGTENLIFDNCQFFVLDKKSDTIFTGRIDQSLTGISYSKPLNNFFDSLNYKKYSIFIETADIDSLSPIIINCPASEYNDILKQIYISKYFTEESGYAMGATSFGNEIKFEKQLFYFRSFDNPTNDKFNLHISYNQIDNTNIIEARAPYIAILLPNPTKKINSGNYLSTSMYYRFDPAKLPYMFDGEKAGAYDCFYQPDSSCNRDYLYDPVKGNQILRFITNQPEELTISVSHPSLIQTAEYFADVLSRDKIKLTIEVNTPKSDLILTYLPMIETRPEIGLNQLLNLLKNYSELTAEQLSSLELMTSHLKASEGLVVDDIKNYYFKLIDYSLKYDFGIFPLFRPTLMFQYENNIDNCRVDQNGILDFSNLTKIKMPASITEQ